MDRRRFIALAGAVLVGPSRLRAQKLPRIGMLYATAEADTLTQRSLAIFRGALSQLGWAEGKTVSIDYRYTNDGTRLPALAAELVSLRPDVIFAATTPSVRALVAASDSIPIVFVNVANPLATGVIKDLARPGGQVTGFANSVGATPKGKLLELLKELLPNISRAAVMFNPAASAEDPATSFRIACEALGMEPILAPVRSEGEIETAIAGLGRDPIGGLILTQDVYVANRRSAIIASAARHRVPAAYPFGFYCTDGGLISYGVDVFLGHNYAANYVDRILKGEKPGDLPVQQPTRFELVINVKTAKTLGLTVPPTLLARADELIE